MFMILFLGCNITANMACSYSLIYLSLIPSNDLVLSQKMQILAGVILFSLCLTIGSLLCWHMYLMCHNMTTIEVSYGYKVQVCIQLIKRLVYLYLVWLFLLLPRHQYREAVRAKWLAKKSGQNYRHQFDQGMRKNIQMVVLHTTQKTS